MGIQLREENVYTNAMATARFLLLKTAWVLRMFIGEGGLLTALHANGYAVVDHDPDFVVIGEGRTFNLHWSKLQRE